MGADSDVVTLGRADSLAHYDRVRGMKAASDISASDEQHAGLAAACFDPFAAEVDEERPSHALNLVSLIVFFAQTCGSVAPSRRLGHATL